MIFQWSALSAVFVAFHLVHLSNGFCFLLTKANQQVPCVRSSRKQRKFHSLSSLSSLATNNEPVAQLTTEAPGGATTARFVAVSAVVCAKEKQSFAVDRLESHAYFAQLSQRDKAFARLLVTTVERRLGQIDAVLEQCCNNNSQPQQQQRNNNKKPQRMNRLDRLVQATLRVGACQLLFLSVPAHAAVWETVQVLRMTTAHGITMPESKVKFANAVLRRISREKEALLASTSVRDNVAPWLLQEWQTSWGEDATNMILDSAMREAPRCLTVKRDPSVADASVFLQHVVKQFEPDSTLILPQGSIQILHAPPGTITTWPLFDSGDWWLQDPSATLPALAVLKSIQPTKEKRIVDLCAAPGGKAAQLASYGYHVTAVELSEKRSRRLMENKQRLGLDFDVVLADGITYEPAQLADGVLLDVPCTATGTASRRPDVLRRDENYNELLATQYKLACNALSNVVKVGGVIVYATCSLLKQESEDQAEKLVAEGSAVTIPFEKGEIPGFDASIDANGWLRVLPGDPKLPEGLRHCDGFFVARLRRVH
jgi:16S rRNA (cytosine967-C5)-methyltransferase